MSDSPTSSHLPLDTAFLRRLRNGDDAAFDLLVRTYADALIRHAERTVGSLDSAQEVVQDVFLHLWREREKIESSWDIAAYLYWLTRNKAIDLVRWEYSTSSREGKYANESKNESEFGFNTGQQTLESEEMRTKVWNALSDVSPRCREIFMLVWDRGLPYKTIAKSLGLAEPTVRSQVSRALKKLAEVFIPNGEDLE